MTNFQLLGHSCPLERYPSLVLPVGQKANGKIVVLYPSAGREEGIDPDGEFIRYDRELQEQLIDFDPEHHRLFAYDERNVRVIDRRCEREFVEDFLMDRRYLNSDPFVRLALAKVTRSASRMFQEFTRCVLVLQETTPKYLRSWADTEMTAAAKILDVPVGSERLDDDATRKKLLIIDDDAQVLDKLKGHFESKGYAVETATDGKQGLGKVLTFEPDLVLADIRMAKMGGYEFLRRFRNAFPEFGTRVILWTEYIDEWDRYATELPNIKIETDLDEALDSWQVPSAASPEQNGTGGNRSANLLLSKDVDLQVLDALVASV
jgi:CheY-like chemotaxis protein